ncbi:MAG: redoxin domain-containing protein [Anaerolineales bacterium]|nr:redoxin domain-containing protein [Anaerolineales bacterium]MCB9128238.1 redoxin domain-containing protein [Ardenticatenales bacterium]
MTGLWLVSYITLWLFFLLIAVVLLSILRNLGTIFEQLSAMKPKRSNLEEGQTLPDLTLQNADGAGVSTADWMGTSTAFAIVSPGCGPCHDYLGQLVEGGTHPDLPGNGVAPKHVILSLGDVTHTRELFQSLDGAVELERLPVLYDVAGQVMDVWGISATPTTLVVDERMTVMSQLFGFHTKGKA